MNSSDPNPAPSPWNTALSALLCAALISAPLSARSPDRDGDGNSDIWQTHFGAPSLNPALDTDGDGNSNGDEAIAGTDPLDPLSCFRLVEVDVIDNGGGDEVLLRWTGGAGKRYQVQESPTMEAPTWISVGAPLDAAAHGEIEHTVPKHPGEDKYFYQVVVSDVDNDRDGLSASEEFTIGTSDDDPNIGGDPNRDDCDAALDWLATNELGGNPGGATNNLREVDVAYLQSFLLGRSQFNFLVTAIGTGGWHQLSSWNLATATANPTHLHTTPPIEGHHPKVKNLPVGNNLQGQPRFVSGTIRSNGNLFLSSRQLNAGGAFTHHDSVGYGSNAGVDVFDYDIAVRTFSDGGLITHHHVVTPVMVKPSGGGDTELHVVSWIVNASTGDLNGLQDSGPIVESRPSNPGVNLLDLPVDPAAGRLSIQHLDGIQYVVTFTNDSGKLSNRFVWAQNDDGSIFYGGGDTAGQTLHGGGLVGIAQEGNALGRVTGTGFLTANRDSGDGSLSLSVWERRAEGFLNYEPFLISDNSEDADPGNKGLALPAPALTPSDYLTSASEDHLGEALATGDFNGDNFADLAVGAPDRNVAGLDNVGEVYLLYGSADGISGRPYDEFWSQDTSGVIGATEAGDRFGAALAAGDFNGDGKDDLAVGCPDEDVNNNSITAGGAINILYGSNGGLSTTDNALFAQNDLGQAAVDFDWFGSVLAAGDFNGDNFDDLAIAATGRDVFGASGAGAVYVMWGSPNGLTPAAALYLHQDNPFVGEVPEDFDGFGRALATGNFNGDNFDDLAIGVPWENEGNLNNSGAVHVLYGVPTFGFGLSNYISQAGFAGGDGVVGAREDLDLFGTSLAAGDFDNDGADDLAIGVPGEDTNSNTIENAGAVNVLYGTIIGLTPVNNVLITQDNFNPGGGNLPNPDEADDEFGRSLAVCNFNGDDYDDLIVGLPHEGVSNGVDDAGAIIQIRGAADGLTAIGSWWFHQESSNSDGSLDGASASGDQFGATLAGGDFNNDTYCDLVVGIPRKERDSDRDTNAGAIQIMPSSASGFDLALDEEWGLYVIDQARGMISDLALEEAGGIAAGRIFAGGPFTEWIHIASVTKCMTLLLAVEAIENGDASMSDDVDVSTLAGEAGGSKLKFHDPPGSFPATLDNLGPITLDDDGEEIPFLEPGDTLPLRLLLHAMMMRSCNRSSVAIGQHIANAVTGDPDEFINMMNDRAHELGMSSAGLEFFGQGTVYGHPAHGCVTLPQHLVTLLREGSKHPLFLQLASSEIYGHVTPSIDLCGTDAANDAKCNNPFGNIQNLAGYPGRLAFKGGNLGGWLGGSDANDVPARPSGIHWATSAQIGIVERAGRTLLMGLQQSGNSGTDTKALFDYGFKTIFTPDCCADLEFPSGGGVIGPKGPVRVKNFAVDTIPSSLAVIAIIDDFEELHLKIASLDFNSGKITAQGTTLREYALLSDTRFGPPTLTDLTQVPTTAAVGDYFTANQRGDQVEFKIWRIGEDY